MTESQQASYDPSISGKNSEKRKSEDIYVKRINTMKIIHNYMVLKLLSLKFVCLRIANLPIEFIFR